jgi:hypothetical protein
MRAKLDKISSVTTRVGLGREVEITRDVPAERGTVVVVEALEEKTTYGELELVGGELAPIGRGDRIAGVLGERQALKGYVGAIPARISPGDTLHILNMGGVIGLCSSANSDFGAPLRVRVLGAVALDGKPANIARFSLPWRAHLQRSAPIILVSGTCMNAGKTTVACEIVRVLSERGYKVAAAKLAGVATQRDLLNMRAVGATHALSFSDAGLPSTTHTDECIVPAAKGILASLNERKPDAIVVEFGDGIMGHYGVDLLLGDRELMSHVKGHILCANDLVAAWGGLLFLGQFGLQVDCVSGPATDNSAGVDYIQQRFGKTAINARWDAERLAALVERNALGAQGASQLVEDVAVAS